MKRKMLTAVVTAFVIVVNVVSPAWATMVTRLKTDSKGAAACGNSNSQYVYSWVKADLPDGDAFDVSYNANGPGATYDDLRIDLGNPNGVTRIDAEIMKRQADGTGQVTHYLDRHYYSGTASSTVTVDFAGAGLITKTRHPWLEVKVVWNDGACTTKTAWDDNWLP